MEQIIIGSISAFLITFYAIPVIIRVAQEKKLYDVPNERKIHKNPIPSLGGLGIFVGFTIALLLSLKIAAAPEFQYYIAAALIIFFVGIKDDILDISPLKKFIGQLAAAAIIVFKGHLLITSMHGLLGVQQLDVTFSYFITFFAIAGIINAFNLIDGVDGLAGSVSFVTCTVFGVYFFLNQDLAYAVLGFAMAASILGFLVYNFSPAKIFMGDTGSMLLGIINAILVIHFIQTASTSKAFAVTATPAIGFAILIMPLMDTLRVFAIRAFQRRSPFSPDRNHLHHILLDKGFTHRKVAITMASLTLISSLIAFSLYELGCNILFFSLVGTFLVGVSVIHTVGGRRLSRMRVIKGEIKEGEEPKSNVRLVTVVPSTSVVAASDE
jgi:UDP-GlcNAc:undecaprenyl-phosphate/decaprenyl-phosphate GlcNAc-1-phosphate transferase